MRVQVNCREHDADTSTKNKTSTETTKGVNFQKVMEINGDLSDKRSTRNKL